MAKIFRYSFIFLSLIALIKVPSVVAATQPINFFVSPSGSDNNQGSVDQPFATIERAQQAVRQSISQGLSSNADIYLRAGTHRLKTPLVLDLRDSGTDEYAITYQSYPGEKATISGGIRVTNWTKQDKNVWASPVFPEIQSGAWIPAALYTNNEPLKQSRFPNAPNEYLTTQSVSTNFKRVTVDIPVPSGDHSSAMLGAVYTWAGSEKIPVSDISDKTITTAAQIGTDCSGCNAEGYRPKEGTRIYLENSAAFLKHKNDWYFNKSDGRLYYQSNEETDPNTLIINAPKLEQLIVLDTDSGKIKNLHFKDLTFAHANWMPDSNGFNGYGNVRDQPISAAITFRNVINSSFTGNLVHFSSGHGLVFASGTSNSLIRYNTFSDIGANCIDVGWFYKPVSQAPYPADPIITANVPKNNTITHNLVENCGLEHLASSGIVVNTAKNTKITNNEVQNIPHSGIFLSGQIRQDPATLGIGDNLIEYNKVHGVMTTQADGGGIYTVWPYPGTVNKNYVSGVRPNFKNAPQLYRGLYFDNQSTSYTVTGNVVYNVYHDQFVVCSSSYGCDVEVKEANNFLGVDPSTNSGASKIAKQTGPTFPKATPIVTPTPNTPNSMSTTPKSGDFNTDGSVNLLDYNLLVSGFGNPYTLLDYNLLVANFGK